MAKQSSKTVDAEGTEDQPLGFEASLKLVEQSVASLESGQLDLDAALSAYEKGVQMLGRCHNLLETAERRVNILLNGNSEEAPKLAPFESGAGAD